MKSLYDLNEEFNELLNRVNNLEDADTLLEAAINLLYDYKALATKSAYKR